MARGADVSASGRDIVRVRGHRLRVQPTAILQVHRELKYRMDEHDAKELEKLVGQHVPLRPRFAGERETIVRGAYLDLPDRSLTRRSLATPQDSQKVRYRHYEAPTLVRTTVEASVLVWIEVKVRLGDLISKERVQYRGVLLPRLLAGLESPPPDATALAQLLGRGPLEPVVAVSYRRVAYEAPTGSLRITIDRDIAFQQPRGPGLTGPDVAHVDGCIVEAKSSTVLPDWLAEALAGTPASGFSKFEAAVRALGAVPNGP